MYSPMLDSSKHHGCGNIHQIEGRIWRICKFAILSMLRKCQMYQPGWRQAEFLHMIELPLVSATTIFTVRHAMGHHPSTDWSGIQLILRKLANVDVLIHCMLVTGQTNLGAEIANAYWSAQSLVYQFLQTARVASGIYSEKSFLGG